MRQPSLTKYRRDCVGFIEAFIKKNELNRSFTLFPHQREILSLAFAFNEEDRLPYDTIIYSCPKKSGKTSVNAMVTCWWMFTQEAPNEVLILANDFEQAQARVFKSLTQLIRNNPQLAGSATIQTKQVVLTSGTTGSALASEYEGSAGGNPGETSWDELWAYDSEADRRLWEELTPVPTRHNSIRFISTYAGFENESSLLRELYLQGVGTDEHPDGGGERLHPTLPVYCNREARLFLYWDHEGRMPWQTEAYRAAQNRVLRPTTYLRLHENRWTNAESQFITGELYDGCVSQTHRPILPNRELSIHVGLDASTKNDQAWGVAVTKQDNRIVLVTHRQWKPTRAEPLDFETTIEAFLLELREQYRIVNCYFDPWQLHSSSMTMRAEGVPMVEFPQTVGNTTRMGQVLFDLFRGRNLLLYPNEDLQQHALAAVAIETPRGFRIAKEKASKKIDGIVALSMACCAALDTPTYVQFGLINVEIEPLSPNEVQAEVDREHEARRLASAQWLADKLAADRCYFPRD